MSQDDYNEAYEAAMAAAALRRQDDERAALQGLMAGWSTFYPHMTEGARLRKAVSMAQELAAMLAVERDTEPSQADPGVR